MKDLVIPTAIIILEVFLLWVITNQHIGNNHNIIINNQKIIIKLLKEHKCN